MCNRKAAGIRWNDFLLLLSLRHGTDQHVYTGSSGRRAAGKGCPEVQRGCGPQTLAKVKGKQAIFVRHSQQKYLSEYLAACPAGERHLVLYSRRHGNGPSPHMSAFMDFWIERNVDILDLNHIDSAMRN